MAKTVLGSIDCRPIAQLIDEVEQQIRDIEDALSDPDIPAGIKKRLKGQLPRLRLLLRRLIAAHEACQAL
jgi:hypothetical protein